MISVFLSEANSLEDIELSLFLPLSIFVSRLVRADIGLVLFVFIFVKLKSRYSSLFNSYSF